MPPRSAALVKEREGLLGVMPAFLPSAGLACKLVTLFPHNRDRETHQAVICVFDPDNGTPIALMDGTYITAARTAAGSALATKLLARDDARVLAIVGTGVQARAHARALPRVREIEEIRVAGRDRAKAEALAEEFSGVAVDSYAAAIRGADIVAATTHAQEPGLNPAGREVDADTIADATLVVESYESALAPPPAGAPELVGVDAADVHAELGELVSGDKPGRRSREEITLYKSVGIAVQDAAAAALVLAAARERSVGRELDLEGGG